MHTKQTWRGKKRKQLKATHKFRSNKSFFPPPRRKRRICDDWWQMKIANFWTENASLPTLELCLINQRRHPLDINWSRIDSIPLTWTVATHISAHSRSSTSSYLTYYVLFACKWRAIASNSWASDVEISFCMWHSTYLDKIIFNFIYSNAKPIAKAPAQISGANVASR